MLTMEQKIERILLQYAAAGVLVGDGLKECAAKIAKLSAK